MTAPTIALRPLGATGISVSTLALGSVALGRDAGLKYAAVPTIPDDAAALRLLTSAADAGINLVDTAPAYGDAEARLGHLLQQLDPAGAHWRICTKVGEHFDGEHSHFDFSPVATRQSVERSLKHLKREQLDVVLIHSNGDDEQILKQHGTLATLAELKREGKIQAVGISHKTVAGAQAAMAAGADVLMATLNPDHLQEREVIAAAGQAGVGVLIKKPLRSGYGQAADLAFAASHAGVSSVVVGTTQLAHLQANIRAVADA